MKSTNKTYAVLEKTYIVPGGQACDTQQKLFSEVVLEILVQVMHLYVKKTSAKLLSLPFFATTYILTGKFTRVKPLYDRLGICWFCCISKCYKSRRLDLSSPFTTTRNYQVKTLKDKADINRQIFIHVTSLKPMKLSCLLTDVNKQFPSCLKFFFFCLVY